MSENIIIKPLEDEIKESYLNYSMSVIIGRAIPDVRDGLKPVQRRILYGMFEMGLTHNSPFKKSARIVGEVMGKYHPHGDAPVYETLVRMAQPFSMRYPLIKGQGNFGSIDRDPPAAMRYTEAKLTKLAEEMLQDLDKDTVDMMDNFDGSLKEPVVLPSKVPNLLINGSSGIAVGMATSIPPHNLTEIVDALISLIDNPLMEIKDLLRFVKGPDFPTGGIVVNSEDIIKIYESGRGSFRVRGKVHFEEGKKRNRIVITEVPYGVSKAGLIEEIAKYAQNNDRIPIKNIRDESDKKGLRVVIEIPKDVDWQIVVNNLYKHTSLQTTFNVQMLVIDELKRPRLMNLKELMKAFIKHRFNVIRRRATYEHKQYSRRAHILEGLMKAAKTIDTVVDIIRTSKSVEEAKRELMETLEVTEEQAKAILDMRLARLTVLELEKLRSEYSELIKKIEETKRLIEDDSEVYRVMKEELLYLKKEYGDERRTIIGLEEEEKREYTEEDLIVDEDIVITLSSKGYIKSTPLKSYRLQRRGGKGLKGAKVTEEDAVLLISVGRLKGTSLFITSYGRAFAVKNYEFEKSSRDTKGRRIENYINLERDERVVAITQINGVDGDIVLVTERGKIKRTELKKLESAKTARGVRVINLEEGDRVVSAKIVEDEDTTVLIGTKLGKIIRFAVNQVRRMGRTAAGVTAIKLSEGDSVVGMAVPKDENVKIITVTSNGYGRKTPVSDYRIQSRGGQGIINLRVSEKTGHVVGIASVEEDDEIILVTKRGTVIRFQASEVSTMSRYAQGVKLIVLAEGDEIAYISVVN